MDHRADRRATACSLLAAVLLATTACSGGIAGTLGQSAKDASSAVGSVALALRLESSGRATDALAQATAEDMVDEAASAYKSAASQSPANSAELSRQQQVLQVLGRALDSLQAARLAQQSGDNAARNAAAEDLERQAGELSRLSREFKP
ncbi:hypothetical protein ACFQ36_01335 [Arthrobacter sp. GCM10027362]